ncbi:MAG: hypothetical protein ACRDGN_18450 [bacterium]
MAFDVITRFFFSDSGLSVGLAQANAALRRVSQSGPEARRGLQLAQIGIQQLALQATGLAGPLGRVAQALLQFGGGNALVLGAAAGIGVVAFAYRALTKDSREAAEAQEKLREGLVRTAAARAQAMLPESARIRQELAANQEQLKALEAERTLRLQVVRAAGGPAAMAATDAELIARDRELLDIEKQRADLSLNILQTRRAEGVELGKIAKEQQETLGRETHAILERERHQQEAFARTSAGQLGAAIERRLQPPPVSPLVDTFGVALRRGPTPRPAALEGGPGALASMAEFNRVFDVTQGLFENMLTPQQVFQRQMADLNQAVELGIISTDQRASAEAQLRAAMGQTIKLTPQLAASIVGAVGSAIAAMRGGGGIGGFLGGLGGILSVFNPIAGAVLSVGGALLSGGRQRDRGVRIDEFGPRAKQQLEETRTGPDRVIIQIRDVNTDELISETIHEITRRQNLDQINRIPRVGG